MYTCSEPRSTCPGPVGKGSIRFSSAAQPFPWPNSHSPPALILSVAQRSLIPLPPILRTKTGGVGVFSGSLLARSKPACALVLSSLCCLSFGEESDSGMTARILDGAKIRDQIFAELSDEVRLLT